MELIIDKHEERWPSDRRRPFYDTAWEKYTQQMAKLEKDRAKAEARREQSRANQSFLSKQRQSSKQRNRSWQKRSIKQSVVKAKLDQIKEDRRSLSKRRYESSDRHDSALKLKSTFSRESRFKAESLPNNMSRGGSMVLRKERSLQLSTRTPAFGHRRSDRGSQTGRAIEK